MKPLLIIFMTLLTSFMVWGYKDDVNSILLFLSVYFIVVYWALGYKWKYSNKNTNTNLVINVRKYLILSAYFLLNGVIIHRAYVFGGENILFGLAWFSITSLLLVSRWKQLTKKLLTDSHGVD